MRQRILPVLFLVITGFAAFGLIANMISNPKQLIVNLLMLAAITLLSFFAVRYFMHRKQGTNNNEQKKYHAAVKQSQKKYKTTTNSKPTKHFSNLNQLRKKKRRSHLTLIEGNKSNKK